MSPNNEDFSQIKRELVSKVNAIKAHIDEEQTSREESRILLGKVSIILFGDQTASPPIKGRLAEYDERIRELEKVDRERIKNKDSVIKMAVGSATIALGGAVIWLANVIKEALKH